MSGWSTASVVVAALFAGLFGAAISVALGSMIRRSAHPAVDDRRPPAAGHLPRAHAIAVLDALTTGVVVCDRTGQVTFRNRAAQALAGTHAGVLIDETVEYHLRRSLAGSSGEETVELYGPPKMVVVVRSAPILDGGAFAFVEDVSERRRIDAVRTDFVANISHELKTPVGALAVLAETLADESEPEVVSRIADRLLDEAHRAASTIDDLLELSRIELGGDQLLESLDVRAVVAAAIERAAPLATQRQISVAALEVPELMVTGDRRQLISAVGNLVENAVKYSEHGGDVQVRVQHVGPWIEFMVADQGVGIPVRDLDRIFERFYRVDKARSRGTGGSGLGLSIVRHVATNHRGEVLVSSREGEGSTFVLRIPATPNLPVSGASPATDHRQDTPLDPTTPSTVVPATTPREGAS